MKKLLFILVMLSVLLSACGGGATPAAEAPAGAEPAARQWKSESRITAIPWISNIFCNFSNCSSRNLSAIQWLPDLCSKWSTNCSNANNNYNCSQW